MQFDNVSFMETCPRKVQSSRSPGCHMITYTDDGYILRCETRDGPSPGPRDPGLQMPWIPGTDLTHQIHQIYSSLIKKFDVTLS
jgi:hypothetical protein